MIWQYDLDTGAQSPGYRPSGPACEVQACTGGGVRSVTLHLRGRAPETRFVCSRHRQEAEDEGLLERPALVPLRLEVPMSAAPTSSTCRWPNCGREVLRHGFCARDLQRLRKQGLSTTEIPTLTAEDIQREYIAWTSNQPSPTIADSADPESAPRVASVAPEHSPVDVLQPDPLVAALEERDLWQRREAAAVERARLAERARDEALAMHERGWQAARKAGHQEAARAILRALDRQPWSLEGLDSELNLALCAAIVSATSDEQGSELLKKARAERDAARAESSSHLAFIDALLAAAGWKRGADDSDAAKIAHVGQIIAERASWRESWQRRAQQLAQALGKKPEDASYQECLAIVRDWQEDRDVWNQRIATIMEALPRHLFAGGERLDQMVVGVCDLLRRAEETVQPLAARYQTTSLGAIVAAALLDLERLDAVVATLDQLGAPAAEVSEDGTPDSTPATRLDLLIRHWQEAIHSALPGDPDGEGYDPLHLILVDAGGTTLATLPIRPTGEAP